MMWIEVVILSCIIILFLYLESKKPHNFPPGPKWLPYFGNALELNRARHKYNLLCTAALKLGEQYGGDKGVLGLKVGVDKIVIPYTYKSIKEMYMNTDIDGRPYGIFYDTRTLGLRRGIIMTDDIIWKEHRRFLIRHLRDFGLGRRGMAEIIQAEAEQILKDMNNKLNAAGSDSLIIPMLNHFSVHVLNNLWSMMTCIKYDSENKELKLLQTLVHDIFASVDMVGALFSHFPILRFIAPKYSGYDYFAKSHEKIWAYIKNEWNNHKMKFSLDNEDRDFMDVYIRKLQSVDDKSIFNEPQLLSICMDLFMAGGETTNKALGFGFINILKNKDIQRKLQKEADTVIGHDRLPTYEDRPRMPYTEAFVLESIRHFMGRSFGIPHRAMKDTILCGYNIPKDSMVIPNMAGILMDANTYKDPLAFNPERFLDNGKFAPNEEFIPFGLGKRRCLGESLGKLNIFIFVVVMMQNFDFDISEEHPLPKIDCIDGATPSTGVFYAKVSRRNINNNNPIIN